MNYPRERHLDGGSHRTPAASLVAPFVVDIRGVTLMRMMVTTRMMPLTGTKKPLPAAPPRRFPHHKIQQEDAGQWRGAALTYVRIFIVLSVLKHRFHPDD